MTLMPLVVSGKILVGGSGGEYGVRGYVVAYDANDGKELWRTFTIPGPGEPGRDTWQGNNWKTGGGSASMTGNYDPALNLVYWGVGNAAPWPGDLHPGDDLYTTSVLALDPDTGKMKAYHQYHPNNSWDWDEVEAPMLIDLQKGGQTIKSLVHPGRDAIFWVLERTPDKINFVAGWPFVYTDVWQSIDPETGKPTPDPEHKPTLGKKIAFCPSLWGGKDWPSAAYARRRTWSTCRRGTISAAAFSAPRSRTSLASSGSGRESDIAADPTSGRRSLRRASGLGSGDRQEGLAA